MIPVYGVLPGETERDYNQRRRAEKAVADAKAYALAHPPPHPAILSLEKFLQRMLLCGVLIVVGGGLIKWYGGDFEAGALGMTLLVAAWWILKLTYKVITLLLRAFLTDILPKR